MAWFERVGPFLELVEGVVLIVEVASSQWSVVRG